MPRRVPALRIALVAVLCATGWLVADVQLNFHGHLNGLFYTGTAPALPPGQVAGQTWEAHTWRVHDEKGYDGQFYHLFAHDPFNRRRVLPYVDSPRYRWRRIGVPLLAYALALGNDDYIDLTFLAVQLGFVFLGAFCLARYAERFDLPPAWGLAFLLIPGVAISLDRMTVDLPLCALTVALLLLEEQPATYAVLVAAPLIRDTGLFLLFAWCVSRLLQRRFMDAVRGAACALPTLAWYVYVALHTAPDQTPMFAGYPLGGAITWTLHALAAPAAAYGTRADIVTEFLALAGIWLALILPVCLALQRNLETAPLLAMCFAVFASLIGYQDIWATAFGLGRTFSPLLIALAMFALRDRRLIFTAPLLMNVPRVALQLASEIRVALHAALSPAG